MKLEDLQRLAGVRSQGHSNSLYRATEASNISYTGTEKARLQRKHNIEPGTPEWFQLWFSLPYLTGESPIK